MIYLRNTKTGETVECPADCQAGFPASDGWEKMASKRKFDPDPESDRKRNVRGLSSEERFDILMDRIEELEARIITLENVL